MQLIYKIGIFFVILAVILELLFRELVPPKFETYAEILPNNKILIDKKLLENVRYPRLVEALLWIIGNGEFANWLFPMNLENLVEAARYRSNLPPDAPFWYDLDAGEKLSGPPNLLSSYENTYWLKNLRVLLKSIQEEARPHLSALGIIAFRDTLIEALRVQLTIVNLIRKHPEILREKIVKPIIISGPPRTMTTHIQSILAQHPDALYLKFADARDPVQPEGVDSKTIYTSADPRSKLINFAVFTVNYLRPFLYYMFRFDQDNPSETSQEDIFLTTFVFGSPVFETQGYMPTYSNMWHSQNNTSAFRFLKICHKLLQWQRNQRSIPLQLQKEREKRWIMKTPEYVGFLNDVYQVYPDAFLVLTHRDPVAVVASFIPMVTYIGGFWNNRVDASKFGEYQLRALEARFNHLVEQINVVPNDQILHVPFHKYVNDNLALAIEICKVTGLSTGEDALLPMKIYIKNNPREGANRFEYNVTSLGANFTHEILKKRFQKYSEAFSDYISKS